MNYGKNRTSRKQKELNSKSTMARKRFTVFFVSLPQLLSGYLLLSALPVKSSNPLPTLMI